MSAPSSQPRLRGLALIGLAAMSWGTTGSVTTVLVSGTGASPFVIGAVRMAVAGALLLAAAWLVSGPLRVHPADRWRCLALGACLAAFQLTYFSAVTMIGIALTALIAICGAPLLITGLATLWLAERLTARGAGALALGVAGAALLVVGPRTMADLSPRFVVGVLLALGACVSYALYVVLAKVALARTAPLSLAAAGFGVAALLLSPLLATPDAGRQIAVGWPWLLYLGAVTTAGAYAAYTIGLREVPASAAGLASLMEPLTATLLGIGLFGEHLGAVGLLGSLLLVAALVLLGAREPA